MTDGCLQVGQLAAHLGVSTHALRAWEARYGLFRPRRSEGGYRLYDADDVRRAQAMCERIALGTPAGEAARLVLRRLPHEPSGLPGEWAAGDGGADGSPGAGSSQEAGGPGCPGGVDGRQVPAAVLQQWRAALVRGCTELDEPSVQDVLARASERLPTDDFVDEIVVPLLRAVAVARDEEAALFVAHAHFAADLVRSALLARHRRALPMGAPMLWLACPHRELHDLGLMAFGLVAADDGWAVRFFGANTPLRSLLGLALRNPPTAVVVSATRPGPLRSAALDVAALASVVPTAVGGPAARRAAALGLSLPTLIGDIVTEARGLRATLHVRHPA